jgi:hypothetical protein
MVVGMLFSTEKIGAAAFAEDNPPPLPESLDPAAIRLGPSAGPARSRRELDDGIIQTLYGVNLELEGAAEDVTADPDAARARIENAIDRLAEVMRNVRRTIMGPGAEDPPLDPSAGMPADTHIPALRGRRR